MNKNFRKHGKWKKAPINENSDFAKKVCYNYNDDLNTYAKENT